MSLVTVLILAAIPFAIVPMVLFGDDRNIERKK